MDRVRRSRIRPPKLRPIARRRRNYVYLLFAILFAISTIYIVRIYPPFYEFPVMNIGIPILPIFFISLAGFIFSALTFIFIQKTQGVIISFFVVLYLILRVVGLTHWIFAVFVMVFFILSEVFILKKK